MIIEHLRLLESIFALRRFSGSVALCCLPILFAGLPASARAKPRVPEVIAYVFAKDRALQPDEIDAARLTRINYAFANIQNGQIVGGFAHDTENFATLIRLKARNPGLKVVISVGGWTWSGGFADMALTRQSRAKFIDSAARFLEAHRLDGIDIDWEYPGLPGNGNTNRPEDKHNYTALLKELRQRFDKLQKPFGRHLLISVATGADKNFLEHTEMRKVARYVDSVNLMSYDYYEPDSDAITGNHAPLYTDPADPKAVSADTSVNNYRRAGVPAEKIVLGVPFYGHAWSDVGPSNHGLFQPGHRGKLQANYKSIVDSLLGKGFTRYWDSQASVPYLYNPASRIFVSYEDAASIELKCQYVLRRKLGGIMFWDYGGDADGSLLKAIHAGFEPVKARK